jgi:hypothetical protein
MHKLARLRYCLGRMKLHEQKLKPVANLEQNCSLIYGDLFLKSHLEEPGDLTLSAGEGETNSPMDFGMKTHTTHND